MQIGCWMPLFTHVNGYRNSGCGSMLPELLVRYRYFWCSLPKHCPPWAVCYRNFAEISQAAAPLHTPQTNPQTRVKTRYDRPFCTPNIATLWLVVRQKLSLVVFCFHPRSRAGFGDHTLTGTAGDQWLYNQYSQGRGWTVLLLGMVLPLWQCYCYQMSMGLPLVNMLKSMIYLVHASFCSSWEVNFDRHNNNCLL